MTVTLDINDTADTSLYAGLYTTLTTKACNNILCKISLLLKTKFKIELRKIFK